MLTAIVLTRTVPAPVAEYIQQLRFRARRSEGGQCVPD
jgi:hypothetical protein